MSARSTAALTRSYRGERLLVGVIGLLALLAGALALVVAQGWLGGFRARRRVIDPIATGWLARQPVALTHGVAVIVGLILLVLGLIWFFRSLRLERRPDLVLQRGDGERLTVTSGAIAEAVAADCETIDGVSKALVRTVGTADAPSLRLRLALREGTDVRAVWEALDEQVLWRARHSLGLERLPVAIRLELGAADRQRVR
ncbi:MAG: alkaline shock response membrane anchor protein AmaP [Sciscionella sp.]